MNFGNTIRLNKYGGCFLFLLIVILILYAARNRETDEEVDGKVDLRKLLIGGIQAAIEGGRKVVTVYNSSKLNTRSKGLTKEGANNPVTDADVTSHCAMYFGLVHNFPQVKVISEEHPAEGACLPFHNLDLDPTVLKTQHDIPRQLVNEEDVTVWIDPLDATQEFTEKLIEYVTTMVCVAVKGVPTIGIIHFPFAESTTWAWVGHNIPHKESNPPSKLQVITSRSHKGDVSNVVKSALGSDVTLIQAGGAGYKSVQVAANNVSAYIHTTQIKKWDICAGDALITALGGKMTTLTGEKINYDSSSDVVNKDGLLATLTGHEGLLKKLSAVLASS